MLCNEGDCLVSKIGDMVPNLMIEINEAEKSIRTVCLDYIEQKPEVYTWSYEEGFKQLGDIT